MTEWRQVPTKPVLRASTDGRLQRRQDDGSYLPVKVSYNHGEPHYLSRPIGWYVLTTWGGGPSNNRRVIHKNRNKLDCNVTNLRWSTPADPY
jgi:hypothetical protein